MDGRSTVPAISRQYWRDQKLIFLDLQFQLKTNR